VHPAAPPSPETLSIGELSRRTGVNIETIRYYERIKILPAPPRTASGRRVYGQAEMRGLAFIRRSRELGFTLDQIRALLALSADDGENTCAEVRQFAAGHLADVRAKIADLRAMARVLSDAVRRRDAGGMPGCALIDTLSATSSLHLVALRAWHNRAPTKAIAMEAQDTLDPHRDHLP
jgi:MerR family transcriptional regulator, mercuric resistance operon regulatory protein